MKKLLFFITACLALLLVRAQDPFNLNFIPPSPNASAIGKFGEVPVSLYTGVPSISIPIYEHQPSSNGLSLNVSLDYHAGGIKVEEIASHAGLGWILNTGGVISRTVRSLPDDYPNVGFLTLGPNQNPLTDLDKDRYINNAEDGEQDVFSFNCNGVSGKFVLDQNGKAILINKGKLKIETIQEPNEKTINSFIITTEDGLKYYFTIQERTITSLSSFLPTTNYVSSWYVSKVYNPFTEDAIILQYEDTYSEYWGLNTETAFNAMCDERIFNNTEISTHSNFYAIAGKRIKRIIYPQYAEVAFNYAATERCDLKGDHALTAIQIHNHYSGTNKTFQLYHSYIDAYGQVTPYSQTPCTTPNGASSNMHRLRLDSLKEVAGSVSMPPYVFYYNDQAVLPARDSKSQDHWGYYNGMRNTANTLVPRLLYNNYMAYANTYVMLHGADRTPEPMFAAASSLYKIKYPTGGTTTFEMEGNKAGDGKFIDSILQKVEVLPDVGFYETRAQLFTINCSQPDKKMEFQFTLGQFCAPSGCDMNFSITDVNGTTEYAYASFRGSDFPDQSISQTKNVVIDPIPNGTYKLSWSTYPIYNCDCGDKLFSFLLSWDQIHTDSAQLIGGLRVKRMIQHDGVSEANNIIKEYQYTKSNGSSSGTTASRSMYAYTSFKPDPNAGWGCVGASALVTKYLVRTTTSNLPLTYAAGTPIVYERVEVKNTGPQNVGKEVYHFSSYTQFPILSSGITFQGSPPFMPLQAMDWAIGNLLQQEVYDATGKLLKRVKNEYSNDINVLDTLQNLKIAIANYRIDDEEFGTYYKDYNIGDYSWMAGRSDKIQSIETTFSLPDSLTTFSTSTYHPDYYTLQKTRMVTSKGKTLEKRLYYPFDYTTGGVLQDMIQANLISAPVSSETWQISGTTEKLLQAEATQYQKVGKLLAAQKQYVLKTTTPMDKSVIGEFNPTTLLRNASLYSNEVSIEGYDTKNNPLETVSKAGRTSYLWGYNQTYPVTSVVNAAYKDVFYTSFEEEGEGNSSVGDSKTGKKSKTDGYTKVLAGLSNDTYTLTYWQKGGNQWTLHTTAVAVMAGTYTLSLAGQVDEVRFYPTGAQMTTYTYEPLVGMTSQTDMNNRTLYYEYDGLNRLSLIRDEQGNALKKYCYNYQGQVEACSASPANWQPTGVTRCKACPSNNTYTTNVQQREEKDSNVGSLSYGQLRWVDTGVSSSCVPAADWQYTATPIRCKVAGGVYTGEQEREQQDLNPCSATAGQYRWVVVSTNCVSCPKPANWQATGNYRCAKDGSNNHTGYQEQEQKDLESCSSTANQVRWVSVGVNCTTCPKPQVWQPTGNYRCLKNSTNQNTGYQEREERNTESCSVGYNTTRWVSVGQNCTTCPKPANWTPTVYYRCVKDASGNNTGYQEQQQIDTETCSATYNQTRWVVIGYNTAACPLAFVCTSSNCGAEGQKCVNNTCEWGIKVYTSSGYTGDGYVCAYHYEFSDGSWSDNYYEYSPFECMPY